MKAQFTVKSLVAALAAIKPHVTKVSNTSQTGWTERGAHKLGFDHVLIRIVDGNCTLYAYNTTLTRSQENQVFEPEAYCTFVPVALHRDTQRADYTAVEDGSFAVPVKVILDYARTFGSSDVLTLATEDLKTELLDKTGHYSGKFSTETRLTIACGRNKCTIVGKIEDDMPCMNFSGAPVEVKPEPIKVSYMHGRKPVVNVAPAPAMHGPAYVPPLGNPPGYMLHDSWTTEQATALWHKHLNRTLRGHELAWPNTEPVAPTPIYAPAVGDSVFVVCNHENGTTTDRVIDVTRVMPEGKGFRGHDRRYGRTRNFYTAQLAVLRQWDRKEVMDQYGNVVIAAA